MEQEIEKLKKEVLDFKPKDSNDLLLLFNNLYVSFRISEGQPCVGQFVAFCVFCVRAHIHVHC